MNLLVDIGNSRVKWARADGDRLGEQRAACHAHWTVDEWRDQLFRDGPVDAVFAATVAGEASAAALRAATRAATGTDPRFVATGREAGRVRNGYADPALLGVDRWLAIVGAYHRVGRACVVADVGTAATIDVIADDGLHGGGFIVPGPALMLRSLVAATSDLGPRRDTSGASTRGRFADNTRDAMELGGRLAVAALIDRSVQEATTHTSAPALLLTGGAAPEVLPYLRTSCEQVEDLVLRGLAAVVGLEAG